MLNIASLSRTGLVEWYRRNRRRTRELFDLLDEAAYYSRPIALRNPIVFYEGHLPAFSSIAFLQRGLGRPGADDTLEKLFARGIDPESEADAVPRSGAATRWPSRAGVLDYAARVDDAVMGALEGIDAESADEAREGIFTALEHEAMHQETLLYMWRRLPYDAKQKPAGVQYVTEGMPPRSTTVDIPAGRATLGAARGAIPFGWDNEFGELHVDVPAFQIDVHAATNADFLAFIADGGYARRELWSDGAWDWVSRERVEHPAFWVRRDDEWYWRGMFEDIPLPLAWPVFVSQAEAAAYARWRGRRLPTEAEYHRAAFGTRGGPAADPDDPRGRGGAPVERLWPWGDVAPSAGTRGNFDFAHWEPVPAGTYPTGASAWGVHDLVGNGWEWTSTVFAPFPGFTPMPTYPEYSADFFDGQHYVLKGASPATARELVRRSFRNWFRPYYPYVYAKFRTVSGDGSGA